ncbi:RlpA-like double-psi beta-barrel-protein domain-containing protein-containing protein [Mycena polygramma]|nr:RlpA-like double-psi beta-barrel-protein domain-containing protein-containing protein [Mycena polygramma]
MHFFKSLSLLAATVLVSVGATPVASSDMSPVRRQVLEGRATYYDPNGGFGACGNTAFGTETMTRYKYKNNKRTGAQCLCTAAQKLRTTGERKHFIVALGPAFYNAGAHCGQTLTVSYQGRSIVVTVQDLCPGCQGTNGIDLSESAMAALDSNYIFDGVITVNWSFN